MSGSGQFDHDILLSYYRIMTKFMISNRVDAWKTDVDLLN